MKINENDNWLDVYPVSNLIKSREIAKTIYPFNDLYSRKSYNSELTFVQQLILNFENYEDIVVPLSERWYSKNQRLRKLFYSYKIVVRMINYLEEKGWINVNKGWIDKRVNFSRLTTVERTEKLKALIEKIKNETYENYYPWDEILIKKNNEYINYKDNEFTNEKRKFVKLYNSFLLDSNIELPKELNHQPYGKSKKVAYPFLYRVFHKVGKSIKNCGRFYAFGTKKHSYLYLNKKDRAKFTIDDEPTVEIDYSCLHIHLAYLSLGIQGPLDDFYNSIDFDIDRETKKKMILIMINAENKKSAERALVQWSREKYQISYVKNGKEIIKNKRGYSLLENKGKTAEELRIKIEQIFPEISSLICSGAGIKMQYHDSEIMEMILKECFNLGIVALPIHDSILIKESEKERGIKIMRDCYKSYCKKEFQLNFEPDIIIK